VALLNLVLAVSAHSFFRFFSRLGIVGLFLLSALDSSFLVLPFGIDLMLIALVSRSQSVVMAIAFVLASVTGSLLGVFVIDGLMRKTGEKGLQRFVGQRKLEKLKSKLKTKGWVTLFLATLLPPPFPFTPVLISASALQMPRRTLFTAVTAGRLIRFSGEAVLALFFGRHVIAALNSPAVGYFVYGLIGIAIVLSVISVLKWIQKPHEQERQRLQDQRS
jgi:membrane protein YqaA with SNARE-associated domain